MPGPDLPRYAGPDTQLVPPGPDEVAAGPLVVAAALGALIWAAWLGWDGAFTDAAVADAAAGARYSGLQTAGVVVGLAVASAALGYRGRPWAGAAGIALGFGLPWSAEAFFAYRNAFWALGVIPVDLTLYVGALGAAGLGWSLRSAVRHR